MERKNDLQSSFKDIYFIPEYPEFDDIKAVYEEVIGSKAELRQEINEVIKCVSHESAEVRYHAVSRLKALLHENQVIFVTFCTLICTVCSGGCCMMSFEVAE